MATSGSVDFKLNMAEITEEAFERCGLELRTGYDAATSRRSLEDLTYGQLMRLLRPLLNFHLLLLSLLTLLVLLHYQLQHLLTSL
jgi:hypothetical protein